MASPGQCGVCPPYIMEVGSLDWVFFGDESEEDSVNDSVSFAQNSGDVGRS